MLMYFIQLLGVAVFACSGCVAASRKQFDLFGVVVIAMVTAIGGGTVRDLLLGRDPVFWIDEPIYLIVVIATAIIATIYARFLPFPRRALRTADALGLSLFTISGTQLAELNGQTGLIALTMGVITGTAGGVIRDLLCAEVPLIMRNGELYATAAVAGSGAYILLAEAGLSVSLAAWVGMSACAALRFASIVFNIRLPLFQSKYPEQL